MSINAVTLLKSIKKVFGMRSPPPRASLIEDEVGDYEEILIKEDFGGKRWQDLDAEMLLRDNASLSYFTAPAFRYYLPAYLVESVKIIESENPDLTLVGFTIYSLTASRNTSAELIDWRLTRVQAFSISEKTVIADFLRFVRNQPDGWTELERRAIDRWIPVWEGTQSRPSGDDQVAKKSSPGVDVSFLLAVIQQIFEKSMPLLSGSNLVEKPACDDGDLMIQHSLVGKRWQELDVEMLKHCETGLVVLTDEAFHYYLPAFLVAAIKILKSGDMDSLLPYATVTTLIPSTEALSSNTEWLLARIRRFSPEQRSVVAEFLRYASNFPEACLDRQQIEQAIYLWERPESKVAS